MEILYYLALSMFILYLSVTYLVFGKSNSISYTVYQWNMLDKSLTAIFTVFCWSVAIPLLIYWIDYSPTDWDFIPFIAATGLCFVGASPMFMSEEMERKVHVVATIVCASAAYLWTLMYGNYIIGIFAIVLSLILYSTLKRETKLYWLEIIAFANIFIQLKL